MSTSGGYHEYIEGCTSGGNHEYIGGCSVHRGYTMSTSGDVMSTWGFQYKLKDFCHLAPPHAL